MTFRARPALFAFVALAACRPASEPSTAPTTAQAPAQRPKAPRSFRDATLPVAERVALLLSSMALTEKVAQLESVNWEHTRLDDAATHELSVPAAQRWLSHGIGEITRIGATKSVTLKPVDQMMQSTS